MRSVERGTRDRSANCLLAVRMQAWREGGCCFRIGCLSSATLQVTARTETLLAAFARRRGDRDGRGDALAQARRRRAAHVWVVLAAAVEQGRAVVLSLLLSPVVVLVSRLLFGRRFVRNGPSPACIATGDARAMRVARVRRGWFSPPQSSRDVARVVLFSSLLSFRRSARGAPSIHPHAGGGARITSGRAAHATRDATRAACGKSERRAPSELAVRVSHAGWSLGGRSAVPLRRFARASPSLRRAPGACAPRAGARCT